MLRGQGEKGGGIKEYMLALQSSHRDVKYSIGHIVNNVVITVHGPGGY